MKFEHCGMVFQSDSVEDALLAIKFFGHLPSEFTAEIESGKASQALTRVYNWATDPDRVARIINLTQHKATDDQLAAGVIDLPEEERSKLQGLLTFTSRPQGSLIAARAADIADIAVAHGATHAMIGGAPFLMAQLEAALKIQGVQPLYSFTQRVTEEHVQPDGTVKKVAIFKHEGFVSA